MNFKIKLYNNLVSKFFFNTSEALNTFDLHLCKLFIVSTSNSNFLKKLHYYYYTCLTLRSLFFFKKKTKISLIMPYFSCYFNSLFLHFYFNHLCYQHFAKHSSYYLLFNFINNNNTPI